MSPQSSTVEVQQQSQPQQHQQHPASNVHQLQQQQQIQIQQQQQHQQHHGPQQHGLQQQIQHPNLQELKSEERGLYLIQLLLSCAHAVANGNMEYTNLCLEQLSFLASLTGDSMQRVASYFMEGLAARITRSWPGVFKALHSTQYPSTVEVLSARQVFFNMCPYLKFAFLTINQAILDSMEGERVVHIIDLQAADAVQWLALLQALRARPGGPPLLKISGISEKKDVLEQMGQRLTEEANRLDIPFQFLPVVAKLDDVSIEMLRVKPGEAVAVSSVMRLHLLLYEEDEQLQLQPQPQPQPQRANGGYITTGSEPAGAGGTDVEPEAPKGEMVNGVVNSSSSKARAVFRSTGGGTFEQVENGDQKPNAAALAAATSAASAEVRGLKRSREANDGEEHLPRKNSGGSPRGASSVVSEGNTQDTQDTEAARQQHANSEVRSEVVDRERTSASAGGGGPAIGGTSKPLKPEAAQAMVMDKVLRMLKQLAPKVMVVVEQESNHNSNRLEERFVQALHYYCALFDSLDSTLPQHFGLERVTLEKHLFGVEIKNIVACEGLERVERHEKLDKWKVRLRRAGFSGLPLSYSTVMQAKRLLGSYQCEGYRLNEGSGCLTLAWQETPLYAASAWHA
ncbi:unnamed protein product [Calypogeia fissa]